MGEVEGAEFCSEVGLGPEQKQLPQVMEPESSQETNDSFSHQRPWAGCKAHRGPHLSMTDKLTDGYLGQWFSTGSDSGPPFSSSGAHLAMSGDNLGCHTCGGRVLPASSG